MPGTFGDFYILKWTQQKKQTAFVTGSTLVVEWKWKSKVYKMRDSQELKDGYYGIS